MFVWNYYISEPDLVESSTVASNSSRELFSHVMLVMLSLTDRIVTLSLDRAVDLTIHTNRSEECCDREYRRDYDERRAL